MDKPYNRYVEDKIECFMKHIFKYSYNDYELKPIFNSILREMSEDMLRDIITPYEYILTHTIITRLYCYAQRVCEDIREKEKENEDYNTGYNCGYSDAISDFTEKE